MSLIWILFATAGLAVSGLPAMLLGARSNKGAFFSVIINVLSGLLGLVGLGIFVAGPATAQQWRMEWAFPLGQFATGLDSLGAIFLTPIFLISALGSIYGLSYWQQKRHPGNGRKLRVCWGLLTAAMVLIVLARDAIVFVVAWEVMALSAAMLVATEDTKAEVRKAAWIYLVATHIGTLCLLGFFALLHATTGSFELWPPLDAFPQASLTALLILALVGFGMKAGLFPLHVWLPGAHANAPSHVSAVLSGVMLKMGIYGLVRVAGLVSIPPVWWGAVVLAMGGISALFGIAFAAGQQDYKRLLAYSSIENVGIVAMGLGLAMLGRSAGNPAWIVLGIGASLFHLLNHSLFKPLMFFGAGSLLHAVRTRRMDRLGGLAKVMPITFGLMLLGAIAICGLPPLNGFASELLLYVGLLKTTQSSSPSGWAWAAIAIPVLAAIGALAVGAFVKLIGCVFQGAARNSSTAHAHDPSVLMWAPMVALAGLCVVIGAVPMIVLPTIEAAAGTWIPGIGSPAIQTLVPMHWMPWVAGGLLLGLAAVSVPLLVFARRRPVARAETWGCGYATPTSRMQYSGASLVQMVVDLMAWMLWPKAVRVRLRGLFPRGAAFTRDIPDAILDRLLLPAFSAGRRRIMRLRVFQHSSVQAYLVYVMMIIVILVLLR